MNIMNDIPGLKQLYIFLWVQIRIVIVGVKEEEDHEDGGAAFDLDIES